MTTRQRPLMTPPGGSASSPGATATVASEDGEEEADDNEDEPAESDSSAEGSDSIGTVTVDDETWNLVASIECSFTTAGNVPTATIAGHAEKDEAVEIVIDFDPTDTGLLLTVTGEGGDPTWSAVNEGFQV